MYYRWRTLRRRRNRVTEFITEEMTLNMGPQHPSTHGVLRFQLTSDGEVIHSVKPDVGYLHRSIEKIAEKVTYHGFMPYTDRVDYVAAMNSNFAWALTVEKLGGYQVPERAEYLRVIAAELNRISSHLIMLGVMAMDIGAVTPFPYFLRERETINDLLEELCGARLTYNYIRIGGVSSDLPDGFRDRALRFLDHFEPIIDEFNRLITYNEIFVNRLANIVIIPREQAIAWALVGPNLRASGVKWDLRKDEPYSIYPQVEFDIPVGKGEVGTVGDCFDRFIVRVDEMRESSKIIRQCLDKMPEGEIQSKLPRQLKPPKGEVYVRSESARGEMGYYLVSNGGLNPERVKIRTGSFSAMAIMEEVSKGIMIADMVALISSLDVIAPEIDR
ncbi:MAG: NADH-quinone oxidoreductase subunit D [Candidatus Latescibacteria bacterium]|nr:NADH-quinone oxidoreductase subunit D [Candidatus Latescibacterota bacterium]NIM66394.1 NADH-quinone oxidoreductase subunit D [Candidatus Latescibacterota bacterium]NIO02873.1 NADH-quinone oxidoreductase subunit D [Candidatus Latescibacterota bacterium]NIO30008.1 NADH-quinone oxidoreductase subunit D [Candidatus Latescibacterota bacterium]NIO57623.1 NADH-quinone oxidoreductase subunit D [Candidatus Latescibacterota bacterium]